MKYQFINNQNRKRIVESYIGGRSILDISNVMGFKRTTVQSIVKNITCEKIIQKNLKENTEK